MKDKKRIKIIRLILAIVLIICICSLIWHLVPGMKDLVTKEGQEAFKEKIQDLGVWGILLLFGLQMLQIFLVILPGEPFEVLAGMCYGALGGALFITVAVFITSTIIFSIVRRYGKKYLYNFFKKEKIDNLEKKLLKNHHKLELILILLFILPASPKDLIVYIGGLMPINKWRFILISTFVRFPSVISSTLVGSNISNGNWMASLVIYGVVIVITGIAFLIANKKDKNKELLGILK